MKPTPDQVSAAVTWAMANREEFCDGKSINWAALAAGIISTALSIGDRHDQKDPGGTVLGTHLGPDGSFSINSGDDFDRGSDGV